MSQQSLSLPSFNFWMWWWEESIMNSKWKWSCSCLHSFINNPLCVCIFQAPVIYWLPQDKDVLLQDATGLATSEDLAMGPTTRQCHILSFVLSQSPFHFLLCLILLRRFHLVWYIYFPPPFSQWLYNIYVFVSVNSTTVTSCTINAAVLHLNRIH